jgi:hypothetical protein
VEPDDVLSPERGYSALERHLLRSLTITILVIDGCAWGLFANGFSWSNGRWIAVACLALPPLSGMATFLVKRRRLSRGYLIDAVLFAAGAACILPLLFFLFAAIV